MMNFFHKRMRKDQKGFTLVELLVVVTILGILATLAVQTLGDRTNDAKTAKRDADIRTIQSAIELYKIDTGANPVDLDGLVSTPDPEVAGWDGPYLKNVPTNPVTNADYTYTALTGTVSN